MAVIVEIILEDSDSMTAKVETECPICEKWIYQVGVFENDGDRY